MIINDSNNNDDNDIVEKYNKIKQGMKISPS